MKSWLGVSKWRAVTAAKKEQNDVSCQPVFYPGWGQKGTGTLPLPCKQFGKPLDMQVIVMESLKESKRNEIPKLCKLISGQKCLRLIEDMFWFIFLDEFSMEDPQQKITEVFEDPLDEEAEPEEALIPHPPVIKRKQKPTHLSLIPIKRLFSRSGRRKSTTPMSSRPTTPKVDNEARETEFGVNHVVELTSEAPSPTASDTFDKVCLKSPTITPRSHPQVNRQKAQTRQLASNLVTQEKEYLFTRMSFHYIEVFNAVSPFDKDLLLKDVPLILVRVIRKIFTRGLPYFKSYYGEYFRKNLCRRITYWLTGVESAGNGTLDAEEDCYRRKYKRKNRDQKDLTQDGRHSGNSLLKVKESDNDCKIEIDKLKSEFLDIANGRKQVVKIDSPSNSFLDTLNKKEPPMPNQRSHAPERPPPTTIQLQNNSLPIIPKGKKQQFTQSASVTPPWYEAGRREQRGSTKWQLAYFTLTATSPLLQRFKDIIGVAGNPFREYEMKWAVSTEA